MGIGSFNPLGIVSQLARQLRHTTLARYKKLEFNKKKPYAQCIGLTLNLKYCLLSRLDAGPLIIVRRDIDYDPVGIFYLERFVRG